MRKQRRTMQENKIVALLPILAFVLLFGVRFVFAKRVSALTNSYFNLAFLLVVVLGVVIFYGFEKAQCHLIQRRVEKGQIRNSGQVLKYTLLSSSVIGILLSVLCFLFSKQISVFLIGDYEANLAIRYLSLMYVLLACVVSLRGYFSGNHLEHINQIATVLYGIALIFSILFFETKCRTYGQRVAVFLKRDEFADAYAAAGMSFGVVVATCFYLILLFVFFILSKNSFMNRMVKDATKKNEKSTALFGVISQTVGGQILVNGLVVLPAFLHIVLYLFTGQSSSNRATYVQEIGAYLSDYLTVFFIPVCICFFLTVSARKCVEAAYEKKEQAAVKGICSVEMQLQTAIATYFGIAMVIMAKPILSLAGNAKTQESVVTLFRIGGFCVITSAMAITSYRLFAGFHKQKQQLFHLTIACGVQIISGVLLVFAFHAGMIGMVISELLFTVVLMIMQLRGLANVAHYHQEWIRSVVIPMVIAAIMAGIGLLLFSVLDSPVGVAFAAGLAILASMTGYVFIYMKMIGFRKRELTRIPGGTIVMYLNK